MGDEETVLNGDLYLHQGEWKVSEAAGKSLVREMVGKPEPVPIEAYARKIEPQYRPFANAAEFATHRDKWVKAKVSLYAPGYAAKIDAYCDRGVYSVTGDTARLESWQYAFDKLLFEDGTPFGIATTEKEATCAK